MPEWLYEAGIGEDRAILVDNGAVVAAMIERHDSGPRAGTVADARLAEGLAHGRGLVRFADGAEAILHKLPKSISTGSDLRVEIIREAIPEPGKQKRAVAVHAPDAALSAGATVLDRISADSHPVRTWHAHETPDAFEAAGWGELCEEARTGDVPFPGGALHIALTPAMTLIDIDGDPGDPAALAEAGIRAAAHAILRQDITGSIGIDVPTIENRARRVAIAALIDDIVPQPFERTAINGFGFVQIVRRRVRPSLAELMRYRSTESAALALLRRAERDRGTRDMRLVAPPALADCLEHRPTLVTELAKRTGRTVSLHIDTNLQPESAHVA